MTQEKWMGVFRHLLTTVGGVAVAYGYIDETTMVQIVGFVVTMLGFGWSIWAKA